MKFFKSDIGNVLHATVHGIAGPPAQLLGMAGTNIKEAVAGDDSEEEELAYRQY